MRTFVAALALALVVPAGATAEQTDSGISGVVRGAGCTPSDLGCRTVAPTRVTVRVVRVRSRAVVATVHPRNGRFRVGLPAGLYTVTLHRGTTAATKPVVAARVAVEDWRFTTVVITLPPRTIR
ncbi:MAG: hypothetical protein ABR521_09900 [Gaiellaceae bacterium]